MKIMCFDPSGSHGKAGDGTTGWSIFKDKELDVFGELKSSNYETKQAYFAAHEELIVEANPELLVVESYKLFGHKAKAQSGSSLETAQLVGFMEMVAFRHNIKLVLQDPSNKTRVTDPILTRMGVFEQKGKSYYCKGEKTNLHMRDSIRHGIFYLRFKYKEVSQ